MLAMPGLCWDPNFLFFFARVLSSANMLSSVRLLSLRKCLDLYQEILTRPETSPFWHAPSPDLERLDSLNLVSFVTDILPSSNSYSLSYEVYYIEFGVLGV